MTGYPWHPWNNIVRAEPEKTPVESARYRNEDIDAPWTVADEDGKLIGGYDSGKQAFAAAQAYLANLPDTAKAFVIYPDGYRLVERKEAQKVPA